jgi:hypothetical protein
MDERCEICGCVRHSVLRYTRGRLCHWLYWATPDWLKFGRMWRFWNDLLLPSAGDYIYDRRGYCDANHG